MKYIKLLTATVAVLALTVSCDRDLPYPLDDVKEGVVIDVVRTPNTDPVLSEAKPTGGNYKVSLSIPKQQGDYSHLDYAQLLCVYTNVSGQTSAKVVADNIKSFPQEITLDMPAIYQAFGLTGPTGSETYEFTTNSVLKDGYTVYGWNQYSGFNNRAFTGWLVDDRAYSYAVSYPVVCRLVLEDFEGSMTGKDNFYGLTYDATCEKISDTQIKINNFAGKGKSVLVDIDTEAYTVSVAKQIIADTYGTAYTNLYLVGNGSVDSCNGIVKIVATCGVDQGTFGGSFTFEFRVK